MSTFFKHGLCWSAFLFASFLLPTLSSAQCFLNTNTGQYETALGQPCVNTIITAVPFLRIIPDARSAAMGDAGIATSADANAMHFNASKLVFAEKKAGFGLTYTPWLKSLNDNDRHFFYASGYAQVSTENAVGLSVRYFSLGDITFTNQNGMPIGVGRPYELAVNASFARQLGQHLSGGFGLNYIYSNLAAGQMVGGEEITAGKSFAIDLSMTYQLPSLTIGLAITNLGQKITYTNSVNRDFIPTNLGVGIAWNKKFDNDNRLTLTTDFNKLLVPTPDFTCEDGNRNGICDYKEKSYVSSILGSFSDAPGGFSEEINEITFSMGAEFWLKEGIALRMGYFAEHMTKGNREYFTTGLGLTYKFITINGSYLIPTIEEKNPLDNTYRVSLLFNFGSSNTSESD